MVVCQLLTACEDLGELPSGGTDHRHYEMLHTGTTPQLHLQAPCPDYHILTIFNIMKTA
jgi:hypothetical protein